jgi:FkbM family methyltransferase
MSDPLGWAAFWDGPYTDGSWEPGTRAWVEESLGYGDLFVDVGAWIGPVSVWALARGARVLAIEPDPVAYGELRRRVPEPYCCAVTATERLVRMVSNGKPGAMLGDSMTRIAARGQSGSPVWGYELRKILRGRPVPRAVKVDVEGYEVTLMRSLGPWLSRTGVSTIQVSCHGVLIDPFCLRGFSRVEWPDSPDGDVRAWL